MTFETFLRSTAAHYPSLAFLTTEPSMVPLFVSNAVVPISPKTLEDCQKFIHAFRQVVDNPVYREEVRANVPHHLTLDNPDSALLCFDFYITPDGPRLIEINTNGAGYPTIALLYAAHGLPVVAGQTGETAFDSLRRMFETEWAKKNGAPTQGTHKKRIVIVDEDIFAQRTLFEFKTYQALFQDWGYLCDIVDMADLRYEEDRLMALGAPVDMIYNRCCDFYLSATSSAALAQAVADPQVQVTPHPSSYALMGDKGRMVMLSQTAALQRYGCDPDTIAILQKIMPPIRSITEESPEFWWAHRKQSFFKPQNTYGSKAVYKGASIAKKRFEELLTQPYVVQPYFEAGTVPVMTDTGPTDFKYDLRFFVYGDTVLLVGARLFQGQVTNFQAQGGGFSPVHVTHG